MKKFGNYIKGTMDDSEMDQYTSKILKEHLGDQDRTERWGKMLAQDKDLQELRDEEQPKQKKSLRIIYRRIAAVAAALLFLVFAAPGVRSFLTTSTDTLMSEHLESPFPYYSSRSGSVDASTPNERLKANSFYHEQEYQEAILSFKQIIATGEANIYDHFYLGLSHLYTNQFSAAIENLLEVKQYHNSTLINEANWFLGLSYLNVGKETEAKQILQAIVDQGQWKNKEAQELLSKLK